MLRSYAKKISDYIDEHPMHALHKGVLGILFLLAGITFVQSSLFDYIYWHAETMLTTVLPSVIVELTNEERLDAALPTLTRNSLLDETARKKAQDMVDHEYFAHDSPEGVEPWYWFDEVGYDYVHAGENLAIYFEDSDDVVEAWMDSPLHKANILSGKYTEIGVAAVRGEYKGYDTVFVVQHFGTPAATVLPMEEVTEVHTLANTLTVTNEEVVVEKDTVDNIETKPAPETPEQTGFATEEREDKEKVIVTPTPPETPVQREIPVVIAETHNDMTVYVSDHDSTSTDKLPAVSTPASVIPQKTFIPQGPTENTENVLTIAYLVLLLLGTGLLVASVTIAIRHNHHAHAYYSMSLFVLLLGVATLHTILV